MNRLKAGFLDFAVTLTRLQARVEQVGTMEC